MRAQERWRHAATMNISTVDRKGSNIAVNSKEKDDEKEKPLTPLPLVSLCNSNLRIFWEQTSSLPSSGS